MRDNVKIGDIHFYDDMDFILTSKTIKPPETSKHTIAVPGRDKLLNLTKALDGFVHFESREIELTFKRVGKKQEWTELYSKLHGYLHGNDMPIIFDDDPDFYYYGLIEITAANYNNNTFDLEIKATVDPYKYELTSSTEEWLWDTFNFEHGVIREYGDLEVNGELVMTIIGSRRPSRPVFITNAEMTLTYDNITYSLPQGRSIIPAIYISEGEHILTFRGNGIVSVEYQGGRL